MKARKHSWRGAPPWKRKPRLEPLTADEADELGVNEDDVVLGEPDPAAGDGQRN